MVWGAPRGVGDLVERVRSNDPSLRSLCLMRGRRFEEGDAVELCDALTTNTVLQELSIGSHAVGPAAAAAFARALAANTTLASLDLGNHSFGDEGLAALAPGIAASASLRFLNLERKGISAAGCAALAAALTGSDGEGSGKLEELLLGQNQLGADGLTALFGGLGLSGLKTLDLSACSLEGSACAEPLAAALQDGRLPALGTLRLDGNQLGAAGTAALAPALAAASLAALHVQRCGLDAEAAEALATALPDNLTQLDISGNASIGEPGAAALAAALAGGAAPRLRRLALCGCGLQDGGIAALAQALAQRSQAAAPASSDADAAAAERGLALDLSGNAAGAAALAALAAAPLSSLCLHDCKLGGSGGAAAAAGGADAGAVAAAALEQLTAPGAFRLLQELDVSANHLGADQLLALLAALTPAGSDGGVPGQGAEGQGADAGRSAPVPRLRLLVIAANPGASDERVSEAVEALQAARPELDVVRRAADTGEGGLMERPGGVAS